tara:strand:- start:3620 stop:3877 length:258 start_codon:yes stop_codon:yes gene_type:complete
MQLLLAKLFMKDLEGQKNDHGQYNNRVYCSPTTKEEIERAVNVAQAYYNARIGVERPKSYATRFAWLPVKTDTGYVWLKNRLVAL